MKIEIILNHVISDSSNHVRIPCDYFEIFILKKKFSKNLKNMIN
jgi:hypothetical protein